jgi:hypothetical protein
MNITAFGVSNDSATAQILDFLPVGLRGQMVGDVQTAEFGDVVIAWHIYVPLFCRRTSIGWRLLGLAD